VELDAGYQTKNPDGLSMQIHLSRFIYLDLSV